MMTRRQKIILFSVITIVTLAVLWFMYSKHQQSQNVKSGIGNLTSLFPFTGTNSTDYQAEQNSAAPNNNYSSGGFGAGNNNTGVGFGTNGNGLGTGGVGGRANSNGLTNVLNLNDLKVGTSNFYDNSGNGSGGGNGDYGTGDGSGSGTDCSGAGFGLGLPSISGTNCGSGGVGGIPPCPSCNPYYGQISLTANGSSSAALTSAGGIVELAWTVGGGVDPSLLNTVCTAHSSDGKWNGVKPPNGQPQESLGLPDGGPDTLIFTANATPNLLSSVYTLDCTNIGSASVTVNESSIFNGDVIDGSSIKIFVGTSPTNGRQSIGIPSTGGNVYVTWQVNLPSTYTGAPVVACTASSSAGDWTGLPDLPSVITTSTSSQTIVNEAHNDGDGIVSRTYTINCENVGMAIATVNVDSLMHGGIIAGSGIKVTAGTTPTNGRQSIGIPSSGGLVYLSWTATLPSGYSSLTGPEIVCSATSSALDWNGGTGMPQTITGTQTLGSSLTENANTGTDLISNLYTVSCSHIGQATATVNIPPPHSGSGSGTSTSTYSGGIIPGSAISITAGLTATSGRQSLAMSSTGGTAYLAWKVTLPSTYDPAVFGVVTCTASSSHGDWVGGGSIPSVIDATTVATSTVVEAPNLTGDTISNTYTIDCGTNVGQATATVNISSSMNGGIIKGSSVSLSAGLTASSGRSSISMPSTGGNAFLNWKVTLPSTYIYSPDVEVVCTASSSASDWTDVSSIPTTHINLTSTGVSGITEIENTDSSVVSNTYTISCTHVGAATAVVNIGPTKSEINIINGSVELTANGDKSSTDIGWAGGSTELSWTVTPNDDGSGPTPTQCTATSSAADWYDGVWSGTMEEISYSVPGKSGGKSTTVSHLEPKTFMDVNTATSSVTIPENTATTTLSQTYTISCSGVGTQSVTVNSAINPASFLDRTPSFQFTVDGGKNTTISSGTPVELKWDVKNLDANSCVGTSFGLNGSGGTVSYAGWGKNYDLSPDSFTHEEQLLHDALVASTTSVQAQIDALLTPTTITTVGTVTSTGIVAQISTLTNEVSLINASTTRIKGNIAVVKTDLASTTSLLNGLTVEKNVNQSALNNTYAQLNDINSSCTPIPGYTPMPTPVVLVGGGHGGAGTCPASSVVTGYLSDASSLNSSIATLNSQITTQVAHKNSINNTILPGLNDTLVTLQGQSLDIRNQIGVLQTGLSSDQTTGQILEDNTKANKLQNLNYQLQLLNKQLDSLNSKILQNHLHLLSEGGTVKEPYTNISTTLTSFSEMAGLVNTMVTGTTGGHGGGSFTPTGKYIQRDSVEFLGGDGSGNGIIGDLPITTDRTYTLTCKKPDGTLLPPQSVNITVSDQGRTENTNQSVTFLANGSASPTIEVGKPVKLTWQVSNVDANSCHATSPDIIENWGASKHKIRHIKKSDGTIIDSKTAVMLPGDFEFFTDELTTDVGGTLKAPSNNVGTNSQTFSETFGDKLPIVSSLTFQLTCGDLPMKTVRVNVSNKPSISFLADGQLSESVATGTAVVLTWELKNIKGGSCRGTSTGNTQDGSGGNFNGWGAKSSLVGGLTNPNQGFAINDTRKNLFDKMVGSIGQSITGIFVPDTAFAIDYTQYQGQDSYVRDRPIQYDVPLVVVVGGTIKPPVLDVDSIGQEFTETVGQDGSISGGIERDYTLTCTGLDGTKVSKTVVINGPSSINGGGTSPTSINDSADPCDNDLDVKSAQVQLTNLMSTYTTISGITVKNFGNVGDDGAVDDGADYPNDNKKEQEGLFDVCFNETSTDPTVAANSKSLMPYMYSDYDNTQKTHNPLTKEMYDGSLLPYDRQWLTPWPFDGLQNPLQGWKWANYESEQYTHLQYGPTDTAKQWPWRNNQIYVGDLASQIILLDQNHNGDPSGSSDADKFPIGKMWLSDGDMGYWFDSSNQAWGGRFAAHDGWDTNGSGSFDVGDNRSPDQAFVNNTGLDRNIFPRDMNDFYFYLHRQQFDLGDPSRPGSPGDTSSYVEGGSRMYNSGADATTGMPTNDGAGGAFPCMDWSANTAAASSKRAHAFFPSHSDPYHIDEWFSSPMCGPGVLVGKYDVGNDSLEGSKKGYGIVYYYDNGMQSLGAHFGF